MNEKINETWLDIKKKVNGWRRLREQGMGGNYYNKKYNPYAYAKLLCNNEKCYEIVKNWIDSGALNKKGDISEDERKELELYLSLLRNLFLDYGQICFFNLFLNLGKLLPSNEVMFDKEVPKSVYVPVNSLERLLNKQLDLPEEAPKKNELANYIKDLRDRLAKIENVFTKSEEPSKYGVLDVINNKPDRYLVHELRNFLKALYLVGEENALRKETLFANRKTGCFCPFPFRMGFFGGPTSHTQKHIEAFQRETLASLQVIFNQYGKERKRIADEGLKGSPQYKDIFDDFILIPGENAPSYHLGNVLDTHVGLNQFLTLEGGEKMTRHSFNRSQEFRKCIETRLREEETEKRKMISS